MQVPPRSCRNSGSSEQFYGGCIVLHWAEMELLPSIPQKPKTFNLPFILGWIIHCRLGQPKQLPPLHARQGWRVNTSWSLYRRRDHYSVQWSAPLYQTRSDRHHDKRTKAEETPPKAQYLEFSQHYKHSTAWLTIRNAAPHLDTGHAAMLT